MNRIAPSYALALAFATSILTVAAADDFPNPRDTEPSASRALPPAEAAAGFRVPEGFRVGVFAAEPDVRNPIAMAWDRRGRLWVAENYTYAERTQKFDLRLRDRVLIFEDADGDGRFDKRTVFTDDVQMLDQRRARPRRRLAALPAAAALRPRPQRRRRARRPGRGRARRLHRRRRELSHLRQRPALGTRRLALRPLRGLVARARSALPGTPDAGRVPLRGGLWRYHPAPQAVRGPRPRHDQPLGPRLERARRGVLHQHGQRPPLAR